MSSRATGVVLGEQRHAQPDETAAPVHHDGIEDSLCFAQNMRPEAPGHDLDRQVG